MDNDIHTQKQRISPEAVSNDYDIAVTINKKIDEVQSLLNAVQNEKNEKILSSLAQEAMVIIQGTLPEEDILKKLDEIRQKIPKENTDGKSDVPDAENRTQTKKETSTLATPEQEAADIIHAEERGSMPMFISRHMQKVAESLGTVILPSDTPTDVIKKFKLRIGVTIAKEPLAVTSPAEKISDKKISTPQIEIKNEEILLPETKKEVPLNEVEKAMERRVELREMIYKERQRNTLADNEKISAMNQELQQLDTWIPLKQKEDREKIAAGEAKRVVEVKEQIDKLLTPEMPKAMPVEKNIPPQKVAPITYKKPTISDYILSKLG